MSDIRSDRRESLFKVGNDVVDMLSSDRKPDRRLRYTLIGKLLGSELRVGRRRRMDNKRLHIGYIRKQREDLKIVDKSERFLSAALYLEREYACAAVWEILLIERVIGMVGERRMIDLRYLRMLRKILDDLLRVLGMTFESQRQGLGSLKEQECRER